jgi:hypothetical protein
MKEPILATLSCRLSATGIRFLGILSRPGLVPLLRSAYHAVVPDAVDPSEVSTFRTHETRLDSGVLSTPGATVPTRPTRPIMVPDRRLPLHNGPPLPPRPTFRHGMLL